MKVFKILFLTTFLSTTNCSFVGDKFLSKKDNNNENEIVVSDKDEVVSERVYIEDKIENKNKESNKGDFLKGDDKEELIMDKLTKEFEKSFYVNK